MITFSLQSGSNGNCIYVEAGGVRLLFDAGITGVQAERRLADYGRSMKEIDAVLISHDHVDHIRCAGVYQRKYRLPVYVTRPTLAATWCDLGAMNDVRYFRSGDSLTFDRVTVHTVRTVHDAADGVVFVVEHEGKRLGILTDLGSPFPGLQELLESLDAAYLECNYDPELLASGSYPFPLQERIRGKGGHLSNQESAALLAACGRRLPRWIAVAHLSEENNRPELAVRAQLDAVGQSYPIHHASRYECSPLLPL